MSEQNETQTEKEEPVTRPVPNFQKIIDNGNFSDWYNARLAAIDLLRLDGNLKFQGVNSTILDSAYEHTTEINYEDNNVTIANKVQVGIDGARKIIIETNGIVEDIISSHHTPLEYKQPKPDEDYKVETLYEFIFSIITERLNINKINISIKRDRIGLGEQRLFRKVQNEKSKLRAFFKSRTSDIKSVDFYQDIVARLFSDNQTDIINNDDLNRRYLVEVSAENRARRITFLMDYDPLHRLSYPIHIKKTLENVLCTKNTSVYRQQPKSKLTINLNTGINIFVSEIETELFNTTAQTYSKLQTTFYHNFIKEFEQLKAKDELNLTKTKYIKRQEEKTKAPFLEVSTVFSQALKKLYESEENQGYKCIIKNISKKQNSSLRKHILGPLHKDLKAIEIKYIK